MKKIITLILTVAILLISTSAFTVSAQDPKLTSRKDFLWGTNFHAPEWSSSYSSNNLELQLHQAAEMGCKIIRTNLSKTISHTDKTVRLANEYGMKIMLIITIPGRTFDDDYDLQLITQTFKAYSSRYDGNHGYGKVDYIQIDNELDVLLMEHGNKKYGINGHNGDKISNYHAASLKNISLQISAAIRGIKQSGTTAKSVINISWIHYGLLKYLEEQGIDWDVTGHDWYEEMFDYGNDENEFYDSGKELYDLFKKPILICETNMGLSKYSGTTSGAPLDDYNFYDPLIECMEDYYSKDFVIGVIFYEFWDETDHQADDEWKAGAHCGFVETNRNGSFKGFKPIYERVQNIIGGTGLQKLDWSKVKAKYEGEENGEESLQSSAASSNGEVSANVSSVVNSSDRNSSKGESSTYNDSKGNTTSNVTYEETESLEKQDNAFTTPVLITVILAGVIVLALIIVGVLFILRKPK